MGVAVLAHVWRIENSTPVWVQIPHLGASCILSGRQICNGSSSFPCSLNYRREAEDHLRVPPRGADQDQDHQLHCRGDDAAAE